MRLIICEFRAFRISRQIHYIKAIPGISKNPVPGSTALSFKPFQLHFPSPLSVIFAQVFCFFVLPSMKNSFTDLLRRNRYFVLTFLILVIICLVIQLNTTKAELFLWTNAHHHPFFDEVFKAWTFLGDGMMTIIVVLALLFVKYRYAVLMTLAYAYSSVVVQVLKRLFNSPRPSKFFEGLNPIRTIDGYPLHEWNSFPSGHSTSAFTLAVVMTYLLPNKKQHWIIIPIAVVTAFSRVYLAQHFFQDVFAGAVLGVILTFQLIWWLENSEWYHSSKLDGRLFSRQPKAKDI